MNKRKTPHIRIHGLSKRFGDKIVLDGVDLEIMRGKSTTVVGLSGIGKSVLIKCILGLLRPDAGEVWIDGENWLQLSRNEHLKRMQQVGMLFQGSALFDSLSVWENVSFSLLRHGTSKEKARERADEVLHWVGLNGIAERMPAELSGGMAKRVGLARAICHKPQIIFLDEPTTGLDPIMADVINNLISTLHRDPNTTLFSITHDMKSAAAISDNIALLYEGEILRHVQADQLFTDTDPILRQLVDGSEKGPINVSHG